MINHADSKTEAAQICALCAIGTHKLCDRGDHLPCDCPCPYFNPHFSPLPREPQLGCAAHGFKFREGCDACQSSPSDQHAVVPPERIWIDKSQIGAHRRHGNYYLFKFDEATAIEYAHLAPIKAALEACQSGATEVPKGQHYRRVIAANDRIEVNKSDWVALVALVKGEK